MTATMLQCLKLASMAAYKSNGGIKVLVLFRVVEHLLLTMRVKPCTFQRLIRVLQLVETEKL